MSPGPAMMTPPPGASAASASSFSTTSPGAATTAGPSSTTTSASAAPQDQHQQQQDRQDDAQRLADELGIGPSHLAMDTDRSDFRFSQLMRNRSAAGATAATSSGPRLSVDPSISPTLFASSQLAPATAAAEVAVGASQSHKYCVACDTPLPTAEGFAEPSNTTIEFQARNLRASRDAPVSIILPPRAPASPAPPTAGMLLCLSCRQALLDRGVEAGSTSGSSITQSHGSVQRSSSTLSPLDVTMDHAPRGRLRPQPSIPDAFRTAEEIQTFPSTSPTSPESAPYINLPFSSTAAESPSSSLPHHPGPLDGVHTPMSLDRQQGAEHIPTPPSNADFGPHLMTRERLSTAAQPPPDSVPSQHPSEFPMKTFSSARLGPRTSPRAAGKTPSSHGLMIGRNADGGSLPASMPYLVPAICRPYACASEGVASEDEREKQRQRTFFDAARPDPLQDVTYIRRLPSSRGCLHAGARFEGTQTSDKNSYDVTVIFTHVDLEASHLCGTINIRGLTEDWPELITFFDAEIIGSKHGFVTGKWGASETHDAKHWGRFAPFRPLRKFLDKPDLRFNHLNKPYVFMRWKERFLVPDHRVENVKGASYDGFYYVCLALDPEGADPVLPLPKHDGVTPPFSARSLPPAMYPSAANGPSAPMATVSQMTAAIMNSASGRIPSTYSPSWNPATSSNATPLRRAEYLGSGPTIASAAAGSGATPGMVDEVGIAGLVHPNWAIEQSFAQARTRNSLSATAAGLVPSQPDSGSRANLGRSGSGAAPRTFTSRTISAGPAWVEVTEMEVEAETETETDSGSGSAALGPSAGPGLELPAGADAICDPPAAPTLNPTAGPGAGPARTQNASATRQSSRGLLDAVAQGSLQRISQAGAATATAQNGSDEAREGPQTSPSAEKKAWEPVVGRCVGYYFSEHSEPFQQISLRYVPERPMGSFELR